LTDHSHRLELTFGEGSLPSDNDVRNNIKSVTMREKLAQTQGSNKRGRAVAGSGPEIKRCSVDNIETARARASRPVAAGLRRKGGRNFGETGDGSPVKHHPLTFLRLVEQLIVVSLR